MIILTSFSSTTIEDIIRARDEMKNIAVAYYYFDFGNELQATLEAMLRSLLSQLLVQAHDIPDHLRSLAEGHFSTTRYGTRRGQKSTTGPRPLGVSQPSISELVGAFQGAIEEFDATYVVIDALDECVELDMILDFMETVGSWKSDSLHLLVTSQRRKEIEDVLTPIVTSQLPIEGALIHEDIVSFIQSTLGSDRKLRKWSRQIKDEIQTALVEGSQGM